MKQSEIDKFILYGMTVNLVRELLASQSIQLDDSDFRAITAILLDLCNDKQIALTHLRRANKSEKNLL